MKSEERASLGWQVFEETNDAVFVTTDDYCICEVNPFAQRLTGQKRSELVGLRLVDLLSSTRRDIQEAIDALAQTGIFHSREAYQLNREGRPPLPVNVSISRIHTPGGTFGVVIARDISDRVDAERKLREAHDSLELRVKERTSELAEVNRQLAEANEQLQAAQRKAIRHEQLRIAGQLASGMAHDINNSVAPISNFACSLLSDPALTPAQEELVLHIQTSAEDIAATVSRLRQLRPVREQVDRGVVEVDELLTAMIDFTRAQWDIEARQQGKKIRLQKGDIQPARVLGDESELRSVFLNLVFNAFDAIPESGHILLSCRIEDQSAVIEVRDDGEGIAEDALPKCMEPFYSTRSKGCGLGLSLSKKIIEQHHGTLELSSQSGVGTRVRLTLPVTNATEAAPQAVSDRPARSKILLVDDDELVRKSSVILMQTKGLKVDVAATDTEALEMLEQTNYSVVISDLLLGETNGIDLLKQCRRRKPEVHTILTTGWLQAAGEDLDDTVADATFQKPIDFDRLLRTLAEFEQA